MDIVPIQSPPKGPFSSAHLCWTNENIASIPWDRWKDFKDGEGRKDPHHETTFFIKDSKHKPGTYAPWLSIRVFWCHFGPEDIPSCTPAAPPMKGTFPSEGSGSRPRAHKAKYNNHTKRGCQCHFVMTRYKDDPDVAVLNFKNR